MFARVTSLSLGLVSAGMVVSLLPQGANAALNVNRNGVTWDATFEGDSLPTASNPAWAVFDNNGFAAESSDGDIYSYVSGSTGTSVSYETTDSTWTSGGAARTVEIRARVPDAVNQAGDGVGSLILGINGIAYDLRFVDGAVYYNPASAGSGLTTAATVDPGVFHIYRLTVDQAANPILNLYIDNSPTPAYSTNANWFTSAGFDKIVFGDISTGGESGKLDVDYISWTSGVHAPVPEPTAVGLLALGGIALARRSRRS